jgi:hypothetical protein
MNNPLFYVKIRKEFFEDTSNGAHDSFAKKNLNDIDSFPVVACMGAASLLLINRRGDMIEMYPRWCIFCSYGGS